MDSTKKYGLKLLGKDKLNPGRRQIYRSNNGYCVDTEHGGPEVMKWLEKNFEAKDDDVYSISFPRTGSVYTEDMVFKIYASQDAKFNQVKFPCLDLLPMIKNGSMDNLSSPRFIRVHFPYSLLPESIVEKKCKIIYTIRNPKDVVVSYYHFARQSTVFDYLGDFKTFSEKFVKDELAFSPFSKHVLEFWNLRHQENILIVMYEEIKADPASTIRKIAKFLGETLTDTQVQKSICPGIPELTNQLPSNERCRYSEGEPGSWKNYFTAEINEKMDHYIKRNFKKSDLKFIYE